jgi:general secretion pathway protein I
VISPLRRGAVQQSGLSLLELLVALAIMAMAMGVLYRVLGSSVRNVVLLNEQQRAVVLVQSLLATRDAVPESGWRESGESAGFRWETWTEPYTTATSSAQPGAVRLHSVFIAVHWGEGAQRRTVEFQTLRPQRRPVPAIGPGS